jgi:hypothetical protein
MSFPSFYSYSDKLKQDGSVRLDKHSQCHVYTSSSTGTAPTGCLSTNVEMISWTRMTAKKI